MQQPTSTLKEFAKYTSSSIIAMIGLSCYILADTFFISRGMGETGLAALNIASPTFNFVFSLGMLFGMGGATKFAIHKGAHEYDEANKVFTHTIVTISIFAVLFVLFGATLSGPIVTMLGAGGDNFEYSRTYAQVIMCFAPFFLFSAMFQNFIRNDGAPRLAMIASLTGNLFNILFDYVLVFPCKLGMLGAALATGFSPIVSMLIMSLFFIKKKNTFKLAKCRYSFKTIGRISALGLPSFLAEISVAIILIVFNNIMGKLDGDTAVAAYAIVINVFYVVNAIFNGVAQGTQPLVSYNHGKGDVQKIRQVTKYAIITSLSLALILYTVICSCADQISLIFNHEHSQALQNLAPLGLRLYFISAPFTALNILFTICFSASNRALYSQIITIIRGFVAILPLAFLFSHLWKITGLWLATPVAECLTLSISITLFVCANKHNKYSIYPYSRQ